MVELDAAGATLELAKILGREPGLTLRRAHLDATRPVDGQLALSGSEGDLPRLLLLVAAPERTPRLAEIVRDLRASARGPVPLIVAVESAGPERIFGILAAGAADFVAPPYEPAQILPRVWRLVERAAASPGARLGRRLKEEIGLRQLIGESPAFRDQVHKASLIAKCDVEVLICGETGTGKDLIARAIHYLSPRAPRPFVAVNCGALPLDLIENELFGHGRAAYTGAATAAPGLIREAEGGTLFLDELDTAPPAAQVKLLRFLQEKRYRPLGSTRSRQADVRVLAATNVDPGKAVERGDLRRDLYYRLNVIQLDLPPLRERPEDIPLLAEHFLERSARRFGRPLTGLTSNAVQRLLVHAWPGNVRELEHAIERAVLLCEHGRRLRQRDLDLPGATDAAGPLSFREAKAKVIADFERGYVRNLLRAHSGNISRAARAARKDRKSFWELVRKHGIDAQRYRRS